MQFFTSRLFKGFPFFSLLWVGSLLVIWAQGSTARAQFDNGNPLFSTINGDLTSDDLAPIQIADDFTLPASAPTISQIMWFGWNGPFLGSAPAPRLFNIDIYAGGPAGPVGAPIHSFTSVTPTRSFIMSGGTPRLTFGTWPIYRYTFDINSAITLVPDRPYWISIYAASAGLSGTTTPFWNWSKSNLTGNNFMFVPGSMPYFQPVGAFLPTGIGEMSFKLFP